MSTPANTSVAIPQRPIRMLVVEDSEDDAFLLSSELRSHGANVDCERVDNEADMAFALSDREWDVIVCDHQMPTFDSLAALRVLKRTGKDIPFILYSGHVSEQLGAAAMTEGVHDFVPKGNVARLLPVLDRELRGAAARRAVRQADSRIQALAFYDGLSSLPNHNLFRVRVDQWLRQSQGGEGATSAALFHIDIDRFLRVNGSFGYEAGNEILRRVALRLGECAEYSGVVARLGGDEFGIFYPGVTEAEAAAYAEWILHAFDAPFMQDRLELYLTPSVGVAIAPTHGRDAYELLTNAETAMAQVKRGGGNGVHFYSHEMNVSSSERLALEMDLRHSTQRRQLFLEFQPIVESCAGRTIAVEALVRWNHPVHGRLAPDRFIPIADESGLIVEIGEWVLRQAAASCRAWHDLGRPELGVSVNVSAVQFAQPKLLQTVSRVLEETRLDPSALVLEITESILMREAETTIGMLRALKNMGVRIAVDDFGTGYSSLSYLKRFPIDILKIDRSFVRDVTRHSEDAAIVRAIVALARSMQLTTVAEGVETHEQSDLLRQELCDRMQGYYFSRPSDGQELTARLVMDSRMAEQALH